MLEAYPKDLGGIGMDKLAGCIEVCVARTWIARMSARPPGGCWSRLTGYDANLTCRVLEACAAACKACGEECDSHASLHEHGRVCAQSCRRCKQACRNLVGSLKLNGPRFLRRGDC